MAIFLRRDIQRLIDEAAAFLPEEKLTAMVQRLNLPHKQSIETQWELVWLIALSRVGDVNHEAAFPGGKSYPDIHFQQGSFAFLAEVTTASDAGYENENPIREFDEAIHRLYAKFGTHGGFSVKIDSRLVGPYGDQRVKLFIPAKSQVDQFVKKHFSDFVRLAAEDPESPSSCATNFEGTVVAMAYDPKQRPYNFGASHLTENVPYSITRNPLYYALKAKKDQLKRSGFPGLKGVIVCDGSCLLLSAERNGSAVTLRDILARFVEKTRSVDFVLTVSVKEQPRPWGHHRSVYKFSHYLHLRRDLSATDKAKIERVFNFAVKHLPAPRRAGYQALQDLDRGTPPPARYAGISGSFELAQLHESMKIKISSRRLLALIAGEITAEEFRSSYLLPQSGTSACLDIFARAIKEGRMIEDARVEPNFDEDDDHVVLVLGKVDAAAAKFRAPEQQGS